jgi:hypothetical protein
MSMKNVLRRSSDDTQQGSEVSGAATTRMRTRVAATHEQDIGSCAKQSTFASPAVPPARFIERSLVNPSVPSHRIGKTGKLDRQVLSRKERL